MNERTDQPDQIEARGLRFPGAQAALQPAALEELRDGGLQDGLARAALSVARPGDRVLVLGGGSGLLPALLAGLLGVRHLAVIEPVPDRRSYLRGVMTANGLIRVAVLDALPEKTAQTLVIADVSQAAAALPDALPLAGLRGAVLRLPDAHEAVAAVFDRMTAAGLCYFPRQSAGDVVTFLGKWH